MDNSSRNQCEFTQGPGYRIYRNVLDGKECQSAFFGVSLELCFFVFGDEASALISRYSMQTTRLISDVNFRKQAGIPDHVLRRNGNPRESRVLKKSGKAPLFISTFIRDTVRRNETIGRILEQMYGTEKLAFTKGLDHLIYKGGGSEESQAILDCKLFEPLEHPTGMENPFHYVCFVCLASSDSDGTSKTENLNRSSMEFSSSESTDDHSLGNSPRDDFQMPKTDVDGSISILEGFDRHYADIASIIGPYGKYPISRKKKQKTLDTTVLENLNVAGINAALQAIHDARMEVSAQKTAFVPIRWTRIDLRAGDALILDCRIPYRTARNKNNLPSAFVPVSLRPVNPKWYNSLDHQQLVAAVKEGKAGNWRKRTFKDCNLEEYSWRSQLSNLPKSALKTCTDITQFTQRDRLIFGISHYSF